MKINFPLPLMTFNSLLYLQIISLPAAQNEENLARQQEHQSYPVLASSPSAPIIEENPPYRTQPLPRGTVIPPLAYNYQQPPSYDHQQWAEKHDGYLSIGAQSYDQQITPPQSLPTHLSFPPTHNPHHRRTRSRSMDESNFDNQPSTDDKLKNIIASQDQTVTPEFALQKLVISRKKLQTITEKILKISEKQEKKLIFQHDVAHKQYPPKNSTTGKDSFFGTLKNSFKGAEKIAIEKLQKEQKSYETNMKPVISAILKQTALCILASDELEDYAKRMDSKKKDH